MFDALRERWKSSRQAKELLRNPTVALARDAIQKLWTNNRESNDGFSPQAIQKQAGGMMSRAVEVAYAENSAMKNREFLSGVAQETAILELIVLSNPKTKDVNNYRGIPGVTGDFWNHLPTIGKTDPIIRELLQGLPESAETANDIHDVCLLRYRICHSHMSVHNVLRLHLKDCHTNKDLDWFKPFYRGCLVWEEASIRQNADLPQLIEPIEAIQFHALIEMVEEGVRYPNLEWEHKFGRPIPG